MIVWSQRDIVECILGISKRRHISTSESHNTYVDRHTTSPFGSVRSNENVEALGRARLGININSIAPDDQIPHAFSVEVDEKVFEVRGHAAMCLPVYSPQSTTRLWQRAVRARGATTSSDICQHSCPRS